MTPGQAALYGILWARRDNPVSPSVEELRMQLGLASKSGVTRMLNALEDCGYITRRRQKARSIELTAKVPPGFREPPPTLALTTRQHNMFAVETTPLHQIATIQPLSCRFSQIEAERWRQDHYGKRHNVTARVIPVRVTIEEI